MWQPLAVLGVWLWMSAALWNYVATHAARIPLRDDLELVPFVRPGVPWDWGLLWALHNEHRVPLPRMIASGLFGIFDDVRAGMFFDVVLLALLAAAMILVARKIRGRTLVVDAVFPLLWLSTGNAENLLMSFQVALILPTVLACTLWLIVLRRARSGFTRAEALVIGLCLVLLPLCGGPGITQLPAFAAGVVAALIWLRGTTEPRSRAARWVLAGLLLAALAVVALYMVGYRRPDTETPAHDLARMFETAAHVVSLAFGIAGSKWWPWSGVVCGLCAILTTILCLRAWRERSDERPRIVALLSGMGAVATLALAIGWGRGGGGSEVGFAARYITLPGPWIAITVFACILYGGRLTSVLVPAALAFVLWAGNYTINTPFGREYGGAYSNIGRQFTDDLKGPLPAQRVVNKWTGIAYPNRQRLYQLLGYMANAEVYPFDGGDVALRRKYAESILDLPPASIQAPVPPLRRFFHELCDVLAVPTDSRLFLEVPAGARSFAGVFGVPPIWVERGTTAGIRAIVRAEPGGTVLFDGVIDPVRVEKDRGPQRFEATFEPGAVQRLVLEITWPEGAPHVADWGYWADVYFD
ncbi:MAG: hypothetical protein JNL28_11885 [Planctomycetes bacterium]|nr:hypothetical protein [Planctomycetota bacterium]